MTTEPTAPAGAPTARPRRRWRRPLIAVGVTFSLLLAAAGVGFFLVWRHLDSNITTIQADPGLLRSASAAPSPTAQGDLPPMNILVMGSDTRIGQGGEGGSAKVYSTAQSDVVMLVHLSGDRKHAIVMSIPRDTWVHVPSCSNGKTTYNAQDGKFNLAFTFGGPNCTVKLFEQVTGLPVDHFIVVDFNGVKDIINALGGVRLCLKAPLSNPVDLVKHEGSGLNLPAGNQVIMGEQGLAFLRARHHIGDGSDLGRLDRQHEFLAAMVKQAQDSSLITDPLRLYRVLDTTTKAIAADKGLSNLGALKNLAQSLTGLKPSQVTFKTIPWKDRGDRENVLIDEAKAKPLLEAIANDTPYPPPLPPLVTPPGAPLKTPPSSITVKILNATGVPGRAKAVAAQLEALGFTVSSVDTAPTVSATTSVQYSPNRDESGRTLTASVVGATSRVDNHLGSTLVLTVGTDYTGVVRVKVAGQPTSSTSTGTITADSTACV